MSTHLLVTTLIVLCQLDHPIQDQCITVILTENKGSRHASVPHRMSHLRYWYHINMTILHNIIYHHLTVCALYYVQGNDGINKTTRGFNYTLCL